MAAPGAAGGKLFGLPRNVAIGAALVGVALVVFFFYKSRSASGATAQSNLPADTSSTDATAAPQLGGTPDSGASAASLSGADLLGAFTSSENALLGGFQSQEDLIANLSGGILGFAQTAQQQVGSLAASGVNYNPPTPTPVSSSWSPGGQLFQPAPAPATPGGYVDIFPSGPTAANPSIPVAGHALAA